MRNAPAPARAEHLYPQRTNTQMRSATVAAAPPHPHAQRTYSKTDAFRLGRNLPHRPCRRLRNVDDRVRRGGCRRTSSQYRTNNPPFVPMQTPSHSTLANRAFGWGTCLHFRKTLRAPSGCPQGDFPTGKILPSGRISGPEGTSLSSNTGRRFEPRRGRWRLEGWVLIPGGGFPGVGAGRWGVGA